MMNDKLSNQSESPKPPFSPEADNDSGMAATFLPVETILKVDDSELELEENQKNDITTSSYVQHSWKSDFSDMSEGHNLPITEENDLIITPEYHSDIIKSSDQVSSILREWSSQTTSHTIPDHNSIFPNSFPQHLTGNFHALTVDDKILLQFDYTSNRVKAKERRMESCIRSEERDRQRTIMRMKRQDPQFRKAEREKGRYRMRLKRLDPNFRTQERERQRERMKIKRSDPEFREKEREQQKTRLHIKRLDPAFKARERAQDRLRMRIKRQGIDMNSITHSERIEDSINTEDPTEGQTFRYISESYLSPFEFRSNQAVFPENISARLFMKHKDTNTDVFHFKKQHILNFNFYNSKKDHKNMLEDVASKSIIDFTIDKITEDELKHNNEVNNVSMESNAIVDTKHISKNEGINPTIINIKNEKSHLEVQSKNISDDESPRLPLKFLTELQEQHQELGTPNI